MQFDFLAVLYGFLAICKVNDAKFGSLIISMNADSTLLLFLDLANDCLSMMIVLVRAMGEVESK